MIGKSILVEAHDMDEKRKTEEYKSIKHLFESNFNLDLFEDADKIYHIFVKEKGEDITFECTDINQWQEDDMKDVLMIDFDEDDILSMQLRRNGKIDSFINGIEINTVIYETIEFRDEAYESMQFYAEGLKDHYIHINLVPELSYGIKLKMK